MPSQNTRVRNSLTLLLGLLLGFVSVSGAVGSETVTISQKQFDAILEKLDTLTHQNEAITRQNRELAERVEVLEKGKPGSLDRDVAVLQEDVEELGELMQVVEKQSLLDRVKVGAEFRTRVDWFEYRAHNSYLNMPGSLSLLGREVRIRDRRHYNEEVHGLTSNRFRLNLSAEVMKNLKLNARLVMYKNWWDSDASEFPAEIWFNEGRVPSDNDVQVDLAFVEYYFSLHKKLPMALTFGRLPVNDSLPTNLREDTPRRSSWPGIFFDTVMDGVALSVGLSEVIGLPKSQLSIWYARTNSDVDTQIYRKDTVLEDWDIFMGHFETAIPGIDDSLFIAALVYVPEMTPIDFRLSGSRAIDVPTELGSFWKLALYAQFERFLGSDFDWFAGFTYMETESSGDTATWRVGPLTHTYGLMSDDGKRDTAARGFHLGLRYTLPIAALKHPKIGIEYNQGSKYYFGVNVASEDPLHKLDTRGDVWDFYYIQPLIQKHLLMRLGYTSIRRRYTESGIYIGRPRRTDERLTNMYLLMDARF